MSGATMKATGTLEFVLDCIRAMPCMRGCYGRAARTRS